VLSEDLDLDDAIAEVAKVAYDCQICHGAKGLMKLEATQLVKKRIWAELTARFNVEFDLEQMRQQPAIAPNPFPDE
jgi:mono/diheme cytochrome c family protein